MLWIAQTQQEADAISARASQYRCAYSVRHSNLPGLPERWIIRVDGLIERKEVEVATGR